MRIISGNLGGRVFVSPAGNRTHPMSDKMRGALFNALGNIRGLVVLDAFSGSGALSFEAISRGATSALAIDIDKAATDTIRKNIATLGVGSQIKAIRAGLGSWLETAKPAEAFDLILADPPYDDLQFSVIQRLAGRLRPGGLLVVSWPGKQPQPEIAGLAIIKTSNFGDSQLVFYRATS